MAGLSFLPFFVDVVFHHMGIKSTWRHNKRQIRVVQRVQLNILYIWISESCSSRCCKVPQFKLTIPCSWFFALKTIVNKITKTCPSLWLSAIWCLSTIMSPRTILKFQKCYSCQSNCFNARYNFVITKIFNTFSFSTWFFWNWVGGIVFTKEHDVGCIF